MAKIVFFDIEDWQKHYALKNLKKHKLVFYKESIDKVNLNPVRDAEIISVFIYSKLDKKTLDRFPNLKGITTRSTGFDHIDLKECKKRNILVYNAPHYGENTVAEHTFGLILSLSRKLHMFCGGYNIKDFKLIELRGFDIKGKTIGIIGLGHIGKHVARIAKGFQMKILVATKTKDKSFAKKFGIKFVSLNNLLKNSDIITLHCPYTKETHHLINKRNINSIKKGALLINTARGGNIDTKALISALSKGNLKGVGLDVLENEKDMRKEAKVILKHSKDNVIISPHNAFNSVEAIKRRLESTTHSINCMMANKKCENLVKC